MAILLTCAAGVFTWSFNQNYFAGVPLCHPPRAPLCPFPLPPFPPRPFPLPPRPLPLPFRLPLPLASFCGEGSADFACYGPAGVAASALPSFGFAALPVGAGAGAEGWGERDGDRFGDLSPGLTAIKLKSIGGNGLGEVPFGFTLSFLE